ncbi:MAG: insulinase family protein [Akkermansiaceae bacterium]|nr:insulinase family protein [Akkermansiaceae bacterium]
MRNATPLVLVIILAITAIILSLTGKDSPSATPNSAAAVQVEPTPWPSEASDIPADPKAIFGNLPNGFRYMILPNDEPPNRLSVRLHIDAGSLMEDDDQRGLAHFLEHMVFNGTSNFKDANALIKEMRGRGIGFGAHVNAYTSFDETVYMLDLPDIKDTTLDLCFNVMRDFGDGALLSPEEIDAERGVILSEKNSRDSVDFRIMEEQFNTLLPGSLIPARFPIGIEEVIETAPRQRFVDFYSSYYIPSRMTFVVVGNVDTEAMVKKITETFGSMTNPAEPGGEPDLGEVKFPEGIEPSVFTDPELSSTEISVNLVRPYEQKPDTRETRTAKFPIEIAHSIIGRRFDRLAKQEGSAIREGSASKFQFVNALEFGSVSVTAAEDRWQEAVPLLEQEFRRALEHGFTEAELSEAKANLLNAYEEAVKRKDTRKSDSLATAIAGAVNDGTVFSTPETSLEIASAALEGITPEMVHIAFTEFWQAPGYHLVLSTKDAQEEAAATLAALYEESSAVAVEPPAAREIQPFGYTDFGTPGEVATTVEVPDLGVTQITLTNNIRINLKPTDFEKNRIGVVARIGDGKLTQPKDKPLFDLFAQSMFDGGGLGKHSNDELSEILAGRNVSASLNIAEDCFMLSGATTPDDQLLQLQLMVASMTDPGYLPEALWQFQKSIPDIYQSLKHTASGPMKEMDAWLHGGDFRFTIPTQSELSAYTIADVEQWLTPQLENGYLELTIVGDFDKEKIIADILATFGTLPERDLEPASETINSRNVDFPSAPAEKSYPYESKIETAIATAIWPTDGIRGNLELFRRLNVLADIYGDRLRVEIREKLGASYSPNAGASGEDALEDYGYLLGQAVGKPDDIPLLLDTMQNIADELSENGATQDELDGALAPILSSLEKSLRENSYWLGTVLPKSQAEPFRLDLARHRDEDYQSINLEEINALAKKYFPKENLLRISVIPTAK